MLIYIHAQIKVKEQLVVRKDMDVNIHETLSSITLKQIKVKGRLVGRKDMSINVHRDYLTVYCIVLIQAKDRFTLILR
jgi:hypothetical protein